MKETIRGGWPDRITNGIAIEDKTYPDKLDQNQILVHEWLFKKTGIYPLVKYKNRFGKNRTFKSYKEFDLYRKTKERAFPQPTYSERAKAIWLQRKLRDKRFNRNHKSLIRKEIENSLQKVFTTSVPSGSINLGQGRHKKSGPKDRGKKMTNIMDIEVEETKEKKIRIKFVAFVGETGPELLMPRQMAHDLYELLRLQFHGEVRA